jgi:hypothetical protein
VNFRTVVGFVCRPLPPKMIQLFTMVLAASLVIAVTAAWIGSYLRAGEWGIAGLMMPESETDQAEILLEFPGATQPTSLSAGKVAWNDDDEVIGVTVAGASRAYLISALERPARHIVNDMIGPVAISITYCNIDRCARAFTDKSRQAPLELFIGGLSRTQGLLLLVDGARFHQNTLQPHDQNDSPRSFPYEEVPITITTWKQWRGAHPETRASIPPSLDEGPRSHRKEPGTVGASNAGQNSALNDPEPAG